MACTIAIFTLIQSVVTTVRFGSVLASSAVARAPRQAVPWGFASYAAQSTQHAAFDSSDAILFLIWFHISWLALPRSSVAFYRRHPKTLIALMQESSRCCT